MAEFSLVIAQGKTFSKTLRYGAKPFVYKAITGITKDAPARITAVGHGLIDGWPAAVVSAQGMSQINANHSPPRAKEFRPVTVVDVDNVEFNDINALEYDAYTSGGKLQFYTPVDLTGSVARLTIRAIAGGAALLELTSSPAAGIAVDDVTKTIAFTFTAAQTAAFDWTDALYELELENADGEVVQLLYGTIAVTPKELVT